jgi:transposase
VGRLAHGIGPREVARRVRAAGGSGYRWRHTWLQRGEAAVAAKPVAGAPRKLTEPQCTPWRHLFKQGARANGLPNERWTWKRLAAVMQVHFGVRYHPAHGWKLLRHLGWSGQVPERRALPRAEAASAHWPRDTWPAIKKSPAPGRPSGLPG